MLKQEMQIVNKYTTKPIQNALNAVGFCWQLYVYVFLDV